MKKPSLNILVICGILCAILSCAQTTLKVTKVVSVYDGDTFRVDLDCDTDIFCKNIPIRVNGIDTPEIKGKCTQEKALAREAKTFTEKFLKGGEIKLLNPSRGKYFRVVADVQVNNQSLGAELLRYHLAVPYDGGKKTYNWCQDIEQ